MTVISAVFTLLAWSPAISQILEVPDSVRNESLVYPIPLFYWSPETKLAGGLTIYYTRRSYDFESLSRTNTVGLSGIYTQKRQLITSASFDRYWKGENYRFSGFVSYSKYPDLFFGIGPDSPESARESFTSRLGSVNLNFQKRVGPAWYAGVLLDYDYSKVIETEVGGLLDQDGVHGAGAGAASGLGLVAVWDTRNSNIFPTTGHYRLWQVTAYERLTFSDFGFVSAVMDIRQYASIFDDHVVAVQGYAKIIKGEPPFYKMALFGGSRLMRGYYPGRYRDRNMVAVQIEYRMPLFWRLGLASFLGYGDVAPYMGNFRLSRLKYSTGLGLRFVLSEKDHTTIRVDIAYGKNSAYPAISIGEAF